MSLENVKAFYERLTSDEVFNSQIQNVQSKEECSQIVNAAGYHFTAEEFETYTAQILEATETEGEMRSLDEKELAAVFGGASALVWGDPKGRPIVRPLYGVVPPRDSLI